MGADSWTASGDDSIRIEDVDPDRPSSFDTAAFDLIMTSEGTEHVPDALKAEREIIRLLRRGGLYALTVPLDPYALNDTILWLRRPDGTIVHSGEPVYHGDPRRQEGGLAYRILTARALEQRFRDLRNYAWVHVARKTNVQR